MRAWVTRLGAVLAVLVGAAGCARHGLKLGWVDDATLAYDPAQYRADPAVVLHRSEHQLMTLADESYTQFGRHELVALQSEGGFDLAEVKVAFRAKNKLKELRARMRHPDGTWEELDPRDMLSDTSGTGERDLNAKFFRFPRVQVGSLLEYYWVIESDGLWWGQDQETVGRYPVRRYLFELEASKQVMTTVTTYNTALPIRSETLPNRNSRLTLEVRDIPHRPPEDDAPNWTFTQPRWSWRVTAWDWGRQSTRAWHTWDERLKWSGGELFGVSGELFDGFSAPQLPECGAAACKISQARAWLRENAGNKLPEPELKCRPLKEVLEARRAGAQERAVLLRRLLADSGLEAHLAFVTRHWSAQTDATFPTLAGFNDMLLYLPPQPELPEGAWLSPTCDDCALNALPAEVRGVQALVFNARHAGVQGVELKSEWRSTSSSDPARPSRVRVVHRARLEGDGALTDEVLQTLEGERARGEHLYQQSTTQTEVRKAERAELALASPLAQLVALGPRGCQPEAGVCTKARRLAIPAYATAESASRWLVPLNALSTEQLSLHTKDREQRVADLYLQREEAFEEVFELEPPPGFVLEAPLAPVAVSGPLVRCSVKVEPTPTGARVTRTLDRSIGGVPLAQYPEVQEVYRAFQDARHRVLSFVKR